MPPHEAVHLPQRGRASKLASALVALLLSGGAGASACLDTATQVAASPRALALAAAARSEHEAFGGQTIDAEGRLVWAGASEADATRSSAFAPAPWQRVLGYWQAIDRQGEALPYLVRFGALRPAYRGLLKQAIEQASASRLQGLGVGPDQGLEPAEQRALQTALDRVAVIDTPWSAAFVSWLARQAGLGDEEFVFSEAHADYAAAAWKAGVDEAAGRPTRHAMRACDAARTPPRIGDLLCHVRDADPHLHHFDGLGRVLATRRTGGAPLPMHCDAVVAVDAAGLDAVGGNVLQSVSLRRLGFVPGTGLLDPSYLPGGCTPGAAGCVDRHMSRQPWSLLLQWR